MGKKPKRGGRSMGYIEQSLVPGETVVYRAKLHWIIFLWPVIFLLIAILSFLGGKDSAGVGVFFLTVGLIWGLNSYAKFFSSEFGLTNRRVLVKYGSFRRHSLELMLPKLESTAVDQGIPGRIFGYGTIIVGVTGVTKERFPSIAAPMEFRRMVQQQAASSQ
jgi:uncharacterized membrane protein YdbT with pleckstrin-like domain